MHDRSVEASMTSMFFFEPVGAVLGFVGGAPHRQTDASRSTNIPINLDHFSLSKR
jgi:hypothetical protein